MTKDVKVFGQPKLRLASENWSVKNLTVARQDTFGISGETSVVVDNNVAIGDPEELLSVVGSGGQSAIDVNLTAAMNGDDQLVHTSLVEVDGDSTLRNSSPLFSVRFQC